MELHQLRYFKAVANASSFTKAAEAEGVAQPSLSQQIQKLEAELGARLFDRLGRKVRLTAAGEALLPEALKILEHVAAAANAVASLNEGVRGPLRVGAIPTILPYFLAPRLREFADLYPEVDLQLHEEITARLIEQLREGDLDLAIVSLPVDNPELVARELFRDRLLLAVSPRHPLAHAQTADLARVESERLLLLKEGHCFRDEVLTVCTRAKTHFRAIFETDQMASLFPLVAADFGVSLVPELAASQACGCRLIPFARPAMRRVGYLRRRGANPGKTVTAMTEWLREQAKTVAQPPAPPKPAIMTAGPATTTE